MKKLLFSLAVLSAVAVTAQVGINTDEPKATLQVKAKNTSDNTPEGILTPQVTGEALTAMLANLGAEQNGMLVYVTSPAVPITIKSHEQLPDPDPTIANVTTPGYYRFNFDGTTGEKSFVKLEPSGLQKTLDTTINDQRYISYGFVDAKRRPFIAYNADSETENYGNVGGIDMTFPFKSTADNVGVFGFNNIGIGHDVKLKGNRAVAIGYETEVHDPGSTDGINGSIAIGANSKVYGMNNIAIGGAFVGEKSLFSQRAIGIGLSTSTGNQSIAIGSAEATDFNSIAIHGKATANWSISIGGHSEAKANGSIAIGESAEANAENSITIGGYSETNAENSIVIGNYSVSAVEGGIAIGFHATANEEFPLVMTSGPSGASLAVSKEGDLHVAGIVLESPNGTKWRITVGDSGDLVVKEHK